MPPFRLPLPIPERDTGLEPVTPSLGSEAREPIRQDSCGSERHHLTGDDAKPRDPFGPCRNAMLKLGARGKAADAALTIYLRTLADDLAEGWLSPGGDA